MHARLETLISLRDRAPVDAITAAHVAACALCSAEIGRLAALRTELRRLPDLAPPELWHAIETRLAATQPAYAARWRWPHFAAAGSIAALVLALAAALPQWQVEPRAIAQTPARTVPVATLVKRSQHLEATLRELPQRPALEVLANSAAIDALQSRIQRLDMELAIDSGENFDGERTRELWSQRVSLLNSLLGVRYAEAVHAGYRTVQAEGTL